MKYHLVVGVLIVQTVFLDEIFARRGGGSSHNHPKSKSPPKSSTNHPANRRAPSSEVGRFSPQNSQFRPVSPEASHSRPAPPLTSSAPLPSSSSRFKILRLSPNSHPPSSSSSSSSSVPQSSSQSVPKASSPSSFHRLKPSPQSHPSSSSVPQPGKFTKSITPKTSRTTIQNQNSEIHNIANEFAIQQSKSVDDRSHNRINGPRYYQIRQVTDRPLPTLVELHNNPTHSRFPTYKKQDLPPPVKNPQANPPALPSYEFNQIHLTRPPRIRQTTVNSQAEANSEPGPSGSQPTAPAALVQAGRAPVPGSRAANKAAKTENKKDIVRKDQAKKPRKHKEIFNERLPCANENSPAKECFDMFILALSWGPHSHVMRYAFESPINKAEWSIHGLWPALADYRPVPTACDLKNKIFNSRYISPIRNLLEENWVSLNGYPRSNNQFWKHEWDEHGRCASRLPEMNTVKLYFERSLELFYKANVKAKLSDATFSPKIVMNNREMRQRISQILGHNVLLSHQLHPKTGKLWLKELRLCYNLQLNLIHCPEHPSSQLAEQEKLMITYSL